jgi:hypothetical protein
MDDDDEGLLGLLEEAERVPIPKVGDRHGAAGKQPSSSLPSSSSELYRSFDLNCCSKQRGRKWQSARAHNIFQRAPQQQATTPPAAL